MPRQMTKQEIRRALWIIRRQPTIAGIAARTGLARVTLYRAADGEIPPRVQELLSQVLPVVLQENEQNVS